MIEAAQALNCKPWELADVPVYWAQYGRVYAQMKEAVDLETRRF